MKTVSLLLLSTYFSLVLSGNENPVFSKAQKDAKRATYWVYPYPQIGNTLREEGKKSILIFNYGSLMDPSSAASTLSEVSMATRRPAVAFGVRRLFDRDVPLRSGSKWGTSSDPSARGMLNVLLSDEPEDFINGVLTDVALEDIPNVLLREEEYDLVPVVVQEWKNALDSLQPRYLIAHIFHAPQNRGATNATLLPRTGYYELTRDASLVYGELFYKIWLKTTYLADGVTPITEWEKNNSTQNP